MTAISIERRLTDAFAYEVSPGAIRRLDDMIDANIARGRQPLRRTWRLAALAAALVIAVPLAAAATAEIRDTETPFGVADAAAFRAEIDAAKQVVPLPAGAEWPAYLVVPDENAGYSRNGGRFWVESVAFCVWMNAWIGAANAGDAREASTARDTILSMPTWQFYSSPFADQSYRDVLDRAFAGVTDHDPVAARNASRPACP